MQTQLEDNSPEQEIEFNPDARWAGLGHKTDPSTRSIDKNLILLAHSIEYHPYIQRDGNGRKFRYLQATQEILAKEEDLKVRSILRSVSTNSNVGADKDVTPWVSKAEGKHSDSTTNGSKSYLRAMKKSL